MRHFLPGLFLSLTLVSTGRIAPGIAFATSLNQDLPSQSTVNEDIFYTKSRALMQEQINLIYRIERAITEPDPNRLRAVRGQLIVQSKAIEGFLRNQQISFKTKCQDEVNLEARAKISCSLYTSSRSLLGLTPVLDRLLSRRGELALVRELPMVSGEQKTDPVLSLSPLQRPDLFKRATPFASTEPSLPLPSPVFNGDSKTVIANYLPPVQPAISPDSAALAIISNTKQIIEQARVAFPLSTKFTYPLETNTALDRFAYDIDPQETQTYTKFLEIPQTGIFRVLPYSAYHRRPNAQRNRLLPNVSQRYPFPSLGEALGGFNPSLTLVTVGDKFQLQHQGVDYSFMTNLGDISLEKLDAKLQAIPVAKRSFFLNYQPPQELNTLQVERRKFLTGKFTNENQSQNLPPQVFAQAPVLLNNTYLVRAFHYQIPEVILNQQPLGRSQRLQIEKLLAIQSSDTIIAFRPVRRRSDGSYTILWRIIKQLDAPEINDLEKYMKLGE
ncbi:MAG: hypothetical protein HC908_01750 [Calothrix sp. SM1_7_51]|nr:hypothetical protein [Calothrix sp. SM1_7_51]